MCVTADFSSFWIMYICWSVCYFTDTLAVFFGRSFL